MKSWRTVKKMSSFDIFLLILLSIFSVLLATAFIGRTFHGEVVEAEREEKYLKEEREWLALCYYVLQPMSSMEETVGEKNSDVDSELIRVQRIKIGCLNRWNKNIDVPKKFVAAHKKLEMFHQNLWMATYYLEMGLVEKNVSALQASTSYLELADQCLASFDNLINITLLPQA